MTTQKDHNWADALRRIKDEGPSAWCKPGRRAGGVISRMYERMADAGLCTRAPYMITDEGRKWLENYDRLPNARVCHVCKKPKGCIPFHYDGAVKYYHLHCFNKIRDAKRKAFGI